MNFLASTYWFSIWTLMFQCKWTFTASATNIKRTFKLHMKRRRRTVSAFFLDICLIEWSAKRIRELNSNEALWFYELFSKLSRFNGLSLWINLFEFDREEAPVVPKFLRSKTAIFALKNCRRKFTRKAASAIFCWEFTGKFQLESLVVL